jgi:hypothetical protein
MRSSGSMILAVAADPDRCTAGGSVSLDRHSPLLSRLAVARPQSSQGYYGHYIAVGTRRARLPLAKAAFGFSFGSGKDNVRLGQWT